MYMQSMRRALFCLGLLSFLLTLIGCAGPKGSTVGDQRAAVRQMRQEVLAELYAAQPELRSRIQRAPGYGVFSNRSGGLLLVGTGSGYGIVTDNATGKETIMRMAQLGVGFGVGMKDYRAVFVFKDPQVLRTFIESGWDFGAQTDAAAKVDQKGAATGTAASAQEAIEIYQFTETGVILRFGMAGTKYWKDPDLN
jgi:lipid-binding SYLF domain-containing protein